MRWGIPVAPTTTRPHDIEPPAMRWGIPVAPTTAFPHDIPCSGDAGRVADDYHRKAPPIAARASELDEHSAETRFEVRR